MYVGRIISLAMTMDGRPSALYRVSSRSFPNRTAVRLNEMTVAIISRQSFDVDKAENPYLFYNCLQLLGTYAVVSNGIHTDILATKLKAGVSMRDALIMVLHAMDYEHDELNTPRIAGIIERKNAHAWLGIISRSFFHIQQCKLVSGHGCYLATYGNEGCESPVSIYQNFDVVDANDACDYILKRNIFASLDHPITAVAAIASKDSGYSLAVKDSEYC